MTDLIWANARRKVSDLGRGGEEIDVRMPSRKLTQEEFERNSKKVGDSRII